MKYRVIAEIYISFEILEMQFEGKQINVFSFMPNLETNVSITKQACQYVIENMVHKLIRMRLREYYSEEYAKDFMFKITILDIQEL